jgi:hypothetical protein
MSEKKPSMVRLNHQGVPMAVRPSSVDAIERASGGRHCTIFLAGITWVISEEFEVVLQKLDPSAEFDYECHFSDRVPTDEELKKFKPAIEARKERAERRALVKKETIRLTEELVEAVGLKDGIHWKLRLVKLCQHLGVEVPAGMSPSCVMCGGTVPDGKPDVWESVEHLNACEVRRVFERR